MHALKKDITHVGRLKKRADFLRVQSSKTRWVTPSFVVNVLEQDMDGRVLCGFTVTKKTASKAVDRNRIKRRLRALANDVIGQKGATDRIYVSSGRKDALELPYDRMKKDMSWALKRLECLAD